MTFRMFAAIAASACLALGPTLAAAQGPTPPTPATAPPPSARQMELAHQILEATGATANMDTMIRTMFSQIALGAQRNLSPGARANSTAMNEAMVAAMIKIKPQLLDVTARAYAQTFTEPELAGILAFYRTPVGRSMAAKQPLMAANIVQATVSLMPEMQRAMTTELCARNVCPPGAKPAADKPAAPTD